MDSNSRSKLTNLGKTPFKVVALITGLTTGAKVYYYKPSFPCRLLDAKVKVKTASAAACALTFTKSTVNDITVAKDKIVTGVTETGAVSNSAIGAIASTSVPDILAPGANYQTACELDTGSNEAIKISIAQCTTNALDATLILEFMPV